MHPDQTKRVQTEDPNPITESYIHIWTVWIISPVSLFLPSDQTKRVQTKDRTKSRPICNLTRGRNQWTADANEVRAPLYIYFDRRTRITPYLRPRTSVSLSRCFPPCCAHRRRNQETSPETTTVPPRNRLSRLPHTPDAESLFLCLGAFLRAVLIPVETKKHRRRAAKKQFDSSPHTPDAVSLFFLTFFSVLCSSSSSSKPKKPRIWDRLQNLDPRNRHPSTPHLVSLFLPLSVFLLRPAGLRSSSSKPRNQETLWDTTMALLPGWRFRPSDDELLDSFLRKKILGLPLSYHLIVEADVYGDDPKNLTGKRVLDRNPSLFSLITWFFVSDNLRHYVMRISVLQEKKLQSKERT